ncbi:hypothetical protein BC629DRAFT_1588269 [Irpex lacteus]|nr:hypothetical protein BC629DRAFT_1588269 [Irpex lacteus]
MGNTSSSGRAHQEETVDFGYLTPQGVYTGPRDWNHTIVTQLIVDRKLAPFYRPLEDYEEDWDDEQILAHMKEPQPQEGAEGEGNGTRADAASIVSSSSRTHHKRPSGSAREAPREQPKHPELGIYRGATDCPICFLYYPSNINHSRCCDQAICTECFVQIKRADPTTTHLVSEPASCPYCVQENFGVVYTPPSWRAGIGSEGWPPPQLSDITKTTPTDPSAAMKKRRKSFGADAPEVVTIDQIRPDWEAKLAAVRATVQRRANRRIVMRQVGDRLIPIGITSGRIQALPAEEGQGEQGEGSGGSADRGSRRRQRRPPNAELGQFLGQMGLGGQDLEELMIMEAMRLSLIDQEEHQRKQKEEEEKKKKREAGESATPTATTTDNSNSPAASTATPTSASVPSPTLLSPSSPTSGATSRHRSSSSLSRSSQDEGRRSPVGALEAALRSATNTVHAVATPPTPEQPQVAEPAPTVNVIVPQIVQPGESTVETVTPTGPSSDSASTVPAVEVAPPAASVSASNPTSSAVEPAPPIPTPATTASTSNPTLTTPQHIPAARTTSFSSSVLSTETTETQNREASYDYLPSEPSSSTSSLVRQGPLAGDE